LKRPTCIATDTAKEILADAPRHKQEFAEGFGIHYPSEDEIQCESFAREGVPAEAITYLICPL